MPPPKPSATPRDRQRPVPFMNGCVRRGPGFEDLPDAQGTWVRGRRRPAAANHRQVSGVRNIPKVIERLDKRKISRDHSSPDLEA
jgi:hypothetical protein